MTLEGPAFGVPGLKWSVAVEGEREQDSELSGTKPETTVKLGVAGGFMYDLWFLEVGVDLTADLEVKIDGSESTDAAVKRGVTEFGRWYAASRLGEVAEQRRALAGAFGTARSDILGAYKDLGQLLNDDTFETFKSGATSWFYLSTSPRTRAEMAINAFQNKIRAFFGVAKATGDQTKAALLFIDKAALLADFESAGKTSAQQARSNIDRSRGKLLAKFDPAKDKLLAAFDGLDTAKVLARDPAVEFNGTFGGNFTSSMKWGGDSDEDNEVSLTAGAGMRIQSGDGDQFELGSQKVLRGKLGLKLGDWGVEASGERESNGSEATKWKLALGGTREGQLLQGSHERVLNTLSAGFGAHARSGLLPNTSAIPTALEDLSALIVDPAADADKEVHSLEAGGSVGLEGELEYEAFRPTPQAAWKTRNYKGKVGVSAMGGVKVGLELGAASKLGKIEGSREKGFKLTKAIG